MGLFGRMRTPGGWNGMSLVSDELPSQHLDVFPIRGWSPASLMNYVSGLSLVGLASAWLVLMDF